MWFEASQAAHCVSAQSFAWHFLIISLPKGSVSVFLFVPPESESLWTTTLTTMINLGENCNLLVQINIRRHDLKKHFLLVINNSSGIFPGLFFSIINQLLTQIKAFILKSAFMFLSAIDHLKLSEHLSLKQNLLSSVGSSDVDIKSINTKVSSGTGLIFL